MWIRCSTRSAPRPSPRSRGTVALAVMLLAATACSEPQTAKAQITVFDPKNHLENALQAARQLDSLANEARILANQARELAASPYSHAAETTQVLREMGELARAAKGAATDVQGLQRDFEQLYPTAVDGLDPRKALEQGRARNARARETAQDLARTAAELERLSQGSASRLQGALGASQAATGQTAAIQSSTQVLAVLSEDLTAMRTVLMAQSRLMAEEAARRSAERAASAEARRQFWGNDGALPANPTIDHFPHARR